jgi:hypothetical protein
MGNQISPLWEILGESKWKPPPSRLPSRRRRRAPRVLLAVGALLLAISLVAAVLGVKVLFGIPFMVGLNCWGLAGFYALFNRAAARRARVYGHQGDPQSPTR